MTNLVNEFFNRNLTEAEAQTLEELLGKSPEDALRFGEKIKQEYFAMGLTVPEIPRHWGLPHGTAPLSLLKAAIAAALLAGAGALGWHFWKPTSPLKSTATMPSQSAPQLVPALPPLAVKPQAALPPPPLEIPERLGGASEEGNRLSVVVELDKPAPVEVCILDPKDQRIRTLYQGSLPEGKWAIHWDGLLSDGSKAPTGNYHILVKSGATQMSKNVSVETGR